MSNRRGNGLDANPQIEGWGKMVIHNINTADGLTNGARGKVMKFLPKEERFYYVLVQFDNRNIGMERRTKFRKMPSVAILPPLTPIEKFHFSYNLGNIRKIHGAKQQS